MSCFFLISFFIVAPMEFICLHALPVVGTVLSPSRGLSCLSCQGLWISKSFQGCWRGWSTFLFLFVEHKACRREIARYCSSLAGVGSTWFIYSSPTWANLQLHFNKWAPTSWFLCEEWGRERKGNEGKLFRGVDCTSPFFSPSFLAVSLALQGDLTCKNLGISKSRALSPWAQTSITFQISPCLL